MIIPCFSEWLMIRVITKYFIVLIVMFSLLADSSYLFCLETDSHHAHTVIDILNIENEHSENHKDSHADNNHHNPFHYLNHTSQIFVTVSAHLLLNIDFSSSQMQDSSAEISGINLFVQHTPSLQYLQHKFKYRTAREHINLLSVFII